MPRTPALRVCSRGGDGLPLDAERAGELAWAHADPFDRVLVAQAGRLGATLVTADAVGAGLREGGAVVGWVRGCRARRDGAYSRHVKGCLS
jgi:hypothetical protein